MTQAEARVQAKLLTDLRLIPFVGAADASAGADFDDAPGCEDEYLTLLQASSGWGVQYNKHGANWVAVELVP